MRRLPRLLMAAMHGETKSFALMVNELFDEEDLAAKNAGKQGLGIFLLFFNILSWPLRSRRCAAPQITPAFPRHIKFYSNSAQMRLVFPSRF
jgi:hypothetical protein